MFLSFRDVNPATLFVSPIIIYSSTSNVDLTRCKLASGTTSSLGWGGKEVSIDLGKIGGSISPSSSYFPSFSSSSSSLLLPPLHLSLEIVGGASGGLQRIYGGRGGSSPPCPHVGSAPGGSHI